jgi:uncharacterized membrane protein affecting hemolysin expression
MILTCSLLIAQLKVGVVLAQAVVTSRKTQKIKQKCKMRIERKRNEEESIG